MSNLLPKPKWLARFPWATLGRSECPAEFFEKIQEQRSRSGLFACNPTFNLIAIDETPGGSVAAERTWESLLLQSYSNWRVLFVGHVPNRLPDDPRFQFVAVPEGTPAWKAKNTALGHIESGWVGVVGVGDVLSPAALYQMAWEINRDESAKGFFTHEVTLHWKGKRLLDFLSKAPWSLPTQLHWNGVGRFWVVERSVLPEFEPLLSGQDEHLALLLAGLSSPLRLVPLYLYYRLQSRVWDIPDEPLLLALNRALSRAMLSLKVERAADRQIRVSPAIPELPRVTAVICFRDKAQLTLNCLRRLIENRSGVVLEVILVDNGSDLAERAQVEAMLSTFEVPVRLVSFPGCFHFNRMNNWAVREYVQTEAVLFLNNDVELESVDLANWARWALYPGIGTVGIQLRFDERRVQHAGIRGWFGGGARLVRIGNSHASDVLSARVHSVYANTFAACMVSRQTFDAVGGLRETDCVNGFGDVAFCFEAVRRGKQNLYLGNYFGRHAEGASRGKATYEYWEEVSIERDYPDILQKMLRSDFGINRVPGADLSVKASLEQVFRAFFRKYSRWLNPIKPWIKKQLIRVIPARDNA